MKFTVSVSPAEIEGTVNADAGVFTRGNLAFGEQTVRLGNVPAQCRVEGGTERRVTISEQVQNPVVRFEVRCR